MGFTSRIDELRSSHRPYLDSPNPEKISERFPKYLSDLNAASATSPSKHYDPCFSSLPSLVSHHPTLNLVTNVDVPFSQSLSPGHDYFSSPPQHVPVVASASSLTLNPRALDPYKSLNLPTLITGVCDLQNWKGYTEKTWEMHKLAAAFPKEKVKCGEADNGDVLRISMADFARYSTGCTDDSPLYVFDSRVLSSNSTISGGYEPPVYFQDDHWTHLSEKRRPPYKVRSGEERRGAKRRQTKQWPLSFCRLVSLAVAPLTPQSYPSPHYARGCRFLVPGALPLQWLLMAPRQSGTTVHVDPLATSAWNTVITGSKRWVLFPPAAAKDIVKAKHMYGEAEDDEAANYFMKVLPKIMKEKKVPCYEFTQSPGETLYVPSGWWHGVLNLEAGVGVTHNFCDDFNFVDVWRDTRTGRRKR